jgi:hypothetical protein
MNYVTNYVSEWLTMEEVLCILSVVVQSNLQNMLNSQNYWGFWTTSIVRCSRKQKTRRFGIWICFRPQVGEEDTYSVGSLRKS